MFQVSTDRYMCPNCHTAEYIREDIDGHHCALCGIVVCEDVYRNDQSFDPTTHRVQGTFIRSANTHYKTVRRATAETRIRNLAERLRLDKSYETEMVRYMNILFANESTERIWNQGRYGEMVIGVLAFIVCRSKGVAVTFQDICDGLSAREKISEYELSRVYYRVATVLNTDSPKLITPSSWIKKAIFKLYSEGACVDDANNDSDDAFGDDDDDDDDDDGFSEVQARSLYPSYYITPNTHSSALPRESLSDSSISNSSSKKLKLRLDEKPHLTIMATRILQVATKQWITVGKKPMAVVAAAIVLAIEYYHGTDDIMKEVAERLCAAKTTVSKRCSEILRYFSTSLKAMGFKTVRNRKDIVKHLPLALMYFDVINDNEKANGRDSNVNNEKNSGACAIKKEIDITKASDASRKTLPASFLKNERMRQERGALIEQCKRLNQAILDGAPFPEDVPLTEEVMLIGKLLFEGVPEDVISNCQMETLKNMKTTNMDISFIPLENTSSSQTSTVSVVKPYRRTLKRYEKRKKSSGIFVLSSSHKSTERDDDDKEEMIEDFNWDPEVTNCLREEQDRKLVGKVVDEREKQAEAEKIKHREDEYDVGTGENSLSAQPKKKKMKGDNKISTKINHDKLNELLMSERQNEFDVSDNIVIDEIVKDSEGEMKKSDYAGESSPPELKSHKHVVIHPQQQKRLLTKGQDPFARRTDGDDDNDDDFGDEEGGGGGGNDFDYDCYSNDAYAMDEDLDIHF